MSLRNSIKKETNKYKRNQLTIRHLNKNLYSKPFSSQQMYNTLLQARFQFWNRCHQGNSIHCGGVNECKTVAHFPQQPQWNHKILPKVETRISSIKMHLNNLIMVDFYCSLQTFFFLGLREWSMTWSKLPHLSIEKSSDIGHFSQSGKIGRLVCHANAKRNPRDLTFPFMPNNRLRFLKRLFGDKKWSLNFCGKGQGFVGFPVF